MPGNDSMMKHPRFNFAILVAGIVMLASANAMTENVKVIGNSSVKANQISAQELKSVFLRERNSLGDGTHVEPVLAKRGPAHEAFLKQYLNRTDSELLNYYRSLVFTGKGSMPRVFGSDDEVVTYVSKTRGAIGYVSSETGAPGTKTLIVEASANAARQLLTRVAPLYPALLRQQLIGGTVRLKITVTAKGDVQNVKVLGGNPILGESAVAAVELWKYVAGTSPTNMEISIPFDPHQ
jgi:TonB family protein